MKRTFSFKCELCSVELNSHNELNAHMARQHTEVPKRSKKLFKCNLCDYETYKGSSLIGHVRTHTGERPFKCTVDDCGLAFKAGSVLKNHIQSKHSDDRSFKCKFPGCGYTAKTSSALAVHKKLHSDDKPFGCSECDFKTKWNDYLKTHRMRHHSTRRDFKCSHPKCTKSFKSSVALKLHFSNRHEKRNIPCDNPGCDKKYANALALNKHKQNVHSKKRLACPFLNCVYRTNNSTDLARHIIVHHERNEKTPCPVGGCQFKGKNSRALQNHMHLHKTLLPCPESGCGHYAPTKEALQNHSKLHKSWGRPFQCPLCSQYYTTLADLQNHCFVHTTEKPFACGHCVFVASFRSVVKSHISSLHENIKFPFIVHLLNDRECLDCNVTLPTAEFLHHCEGHVDPAVMEA